MISYQLPRGELFNVYKTCEDGLSEPEAKRRLEESGPNTLRKAEKKATLEPICLNICNFLPCSLKLRRCYRL